jgi:hypothetical protein
MAFDQSKADEICSLIAEGVPLREICRQDGMPKWRTVYDWMEANQEFAAHFARARITGFDAIAQEALSIADDGRNDWMDRNRPDGSADQVLNAEHVQRSKLRIETRLKLLAKWDPKRYGEKLALTDGEGKPIFSGIVRKVVDPKND